MGKIIIVSHYYPPYGMVGGERMKRLFEHLKRKKEVILITPYAKGDNIINYKRQDPGEGYFLSPRFRQIAKIFNKMMFPIDNKMVNMFFLKDILENIVEKGDTVIYSLPPPSLSLICAYMAKKKEANFIVDFRDIWKNGFISNWHFIDKYTEKYVLRYADALVVSSPAIKRIYQKRFNRNIYTVFTGASNIPEIKINRKDTYTIVYTGRIRKINGIKEFVEIFSMLDKDIKNKFEIRLYGADEDVNIKKVIEKTDNKNIKYFGQVEHNIARKVQKEADLLLLPILSGNGLNEVIPYKFYEYLENNIPILGFTTQSNYIKELIAKRGIVIYNNKKSMEKKLREYPDNLSIEDLSFLTLKENLKLWEEILENI